MTFFAPPSTCARALGVGEQAGRLDHDVGAQVAPGQLARVALGEHLERLPAHRDLVGGGLDLERQAAEDRVIFQQVSQGGVVGEVVGADQLDVRPGSENGPEEVAADAAEPVDANPDGHRFHLLDDEIAGRREYRVRRPVLEPVAGPVAVLNDTI